MWKIIWREIAFTKGRFIAAVLAVTLAVAFLTTIWGGKMLLWEGAYAAQTTPLNADFYAVGKLRPRGDSPDAESRQALSADLVTTIEAVDGVSHAVPLFQGTGVLMDSRGKPLPRSVGATKIQGSFPYPPGPALVEGRLPSGEKEVLLELSTAQRADLEVGAQATLVWGGAVHQMKLVGTARFEQPLGYQSLAFVDGNKAQEWFAPDNRVRLIGINVAPSISLDMAQEKLTAAVADKAQILTGAQLRLEYENVLRNSVAPVNHFFILFVALFLAAGLFLLTNAFGVYVTSRVRLLGLLSSLGYQPQARSRFIWGLALIVGLLGSGLGVALGFGLTWIAGQILVAFGWAYAGNWPLSTVALILSFITGVGVTLLAAVRPAFRAGRITPTATVISADKDTVPQARPWLGIAAMAGAALLLAIAWVFPQAGQLSGVSLWLLSGIVLFLVAVAALLPWWQRIFLWAIGALAKGWNSLPIQLAVQDLRRYPRRVTVGSTAMVVGVAVATAGGVLAASAQESFRAGAVEELQSDLVITALQPATNADQVLKAVRETKGVSQASAEVVSTRLLISHGEETARSVTVVGLSRQSLQQTVRLQVVEGQTDLLSKGRVLISARLAAASGWRVGDQVSLGGTLANYSTEIAAVVSSSIVEGDIFMDPKYLQNIVSEAEITRKYIFVDLESASGTLPAKETDAVATLEPEKQLLQKAVDPFMVYQVMERQDLAASVAQIPGQILWFTYLLLALAIGVALLGVANAIALVVMERQRGLPLLRALGMTPGQAAAAIRWEALLMAGNGAMAGWLAGLLTGMMLRYSLRFQGFGVLSVPWLEQLLLIAVGTILAVAVATVTTRDFQARDSLIPR